MVFGPTQAIHLLDARIAAANAALDGTIPKKTALFSVGEMNEMRNLIAYLAIEARKAPADESQHPARRAGDFPDYARPMSHLPEPA
jgi:hypothetical protein